ncbi:hypothetical protein [Aliirhizobium smilacinae]|uniref:Uncharacterized protein n=1 Tax=Aliirhizobium smilacinae TaxID=1395944 RepID=A0A5C4XQJ8_9HYPH|nr:hypothetical protein [Rhizobium smilacinae]TNM64780.1 hypothetical protein FHP24_00250 [Rhizobium smilacinae]
MTRRPNLFLYTLIAAAIVAPQYADARGGFGGRMPRMNFGGGGMHGGSFHGYNAPTHFAPRAHPAVAPHPPYPRPGPHPTPTPRPDPAGHHPHPPGPGPGPGPHPPGPPPGPYPPGPPHPPPPGPYWPGYWGPAAVWGAAAAVTVGTIIATLPPECTTVVVGGISYRDCSGNWFEPRYDGHVVVYVAVANPH